TMAGSRARWNVAPFLGRVGGARLAVAPAHEALRVGKGRRLRDGKADPGIDTVIGGSGPMPKARARNDVSGITVGELGRAACWPIDGDRAVVPDRRLWRATGKMQRVERADRDLVGVTAGHFSKPRSAVEAFDGDHVRNAIAHEDVAGEILEIHSAQSGKV